MNGDWRYGTLMELSKAENENVWTALSMYSGSEHVDAALVYFGSPEYFGDKLEKFI